MARNVNFGKMLLAGALTFAICWFAGVNIDKIDLPKYVFESVKIVSIMVLAAVIYGGLNLMLKMEYAQELVKRMRK